MRIYCSTENRCYEIDFNLVRFQCFLKHYNISGTSISNQILLLIGKLYNIRDFRNFCPT